MIYWKILTNGISIHTNFDQNRSINERARKFWHKSGPI